MLPPRPVDPAQAALAHLAATLREKPTDPLHRAAYLDALIHYARTHVGLVEVNLPELAHPVYVRGGTSDILNLMQVFNQDEYRFELPAPPSRILDLGAYAGYAAVFLATKYPAAAILSVEPSPANFRMLQINTLPYRAITALNLGVWDRPGQLRVAGRDAGDWGTMLVEADAGIPCDTVPGLMARVGWTGIDFLKCDVEGTEARLFADPRAPWLTQVEALAVETHDRMIPGCEAAVDRCFPSETHHRGRYGELDLFVRRQDRGTVPDVAAPLRLLHAEPGAAPFTVHNVGEGSHAFFLFDDTACQLHPNRPGEPAPQLAMTRPLHRQTRFSARTRVAHPDSQPVLFSLTIQDAATGTVVFKARRTVPGGAEVAWSERLPPIAGPHRIVLATRMADEAAEPGHAWAQWFDPVLT